MSNAALATAPQPLELDIHPVAGRIGAEIRGVQLSADLDAATIEAIQAALVQHKVIFFRDQTHLDDQSQEGFAKLLGEPVAHPTVPVVDGTSYLLQLDGADPAKLERYRKVFTSTVYETEHPVVRVHPISGERALQLGHFVKRIKGYSLADSQHLFAVLQGHVTRLENTVRWRWQAGDVAIWDNRATQHYAVDDYGTQPRVVRRVTLAGEVPVGVNGQLSRTTRKG